MSLLTKIGLHAENKTRQKEANPHQIDVPCKRFLNCYRFRFKFEKYCFEDRQAAIFFYGEL